MKRRMQHLIVLICFCVWIFPMGIFIKPIKENKVCAGKRAICLCTAYLNKQPKLREIKDELNEDVRSSAQIAQVLLSPKYLIPQDLVKFFEAEDHYVDDVQPLYLKDVLPRIDHIPKSA